VYAPKIVALQRLSGGTAAHPGAFQVLFSSVAALLGSPGQTNYSAANSQLDALAVTSQQKGAVATSVQWGAWAGAGMAAGDASTKARVERTGLGLVAPGPGLAAMSSLLRQRSDDTPALLAAVPFKWDRFLQFQYRGQPVPDMFEDFIKINLNNEILSQMQQAVTTTTEATAGGAGVVEANREEYMLTLVNDAVHAVLGTTIDPGQPLMAAGLDSLSAVEFRNGLESRVGVELPSTLVFDYPTVESMAAFLVKKVKPATTVAAVGSATSVADFGGYVSTTGDGSNAMGVVAQTRKHSYNTIIVISGMAIKSPSNALATIHPIDASTLIPYSRWDVDLHESLYGGVPVRFGPTLKEIELFDTQAMMMSDAEAVLMDPQQRMLLELTGELLLQGGNIITPVSLGAFIGLSSTDYAKVNSKWNLITTPYF
jgi:acyl carrier protein